MKIEFFHDVICSFCFPMSDRMHEIKKEFTDLEIVHKSFALGWEEDDFIKTFGSREAVKPEVINHWIYANKNDERHRFNIEGMKQTNFNFPTSQNGLLAAKAAGLAGNQTSYWEVFDKLQEGLFMRNLNIEEVAVIEKLVKETSLDFDKWKEQFHKEDTWNAVLQDFQLAKAYGLTSVPALIINEKYSIIGAQPKNVILNTLKEIQAEEIQHLQSAGTDTNVCSFEDGKWHCE